MAFDKFNLNKNIVDFMNSKGFVSFSPIQNEVIPLLLKNHQVLANAPTGSGKTFAFLLPLMQKIDLDLKKPQLIIFSPTRELASQIEKEIREINHFFENEISFISIFGGKEKDEQQKKYLNKQIIIATPSRFEIIFKLNPTSLSSVKNIVLDEIDMLEDFGFLDSFKNMYNQIFKTNPNISVFSATLNQQLISKIKKNFTGEFKTILIEQNKNIEVEVVQTNDRSKEKLLINLLNQDWLNPFLAIIFVNKNTEVDRYYKILLKNGFKEVRKFNNSLTQRERKKLLNDLKQNKIIYLITTDLMARGMDFEGVSHIINLDMPLDNQYFIHRIGRTNRSQDTLGKIYSIADENDLFKLSKFEKNQKIKIKKIKL